MNRILMDRRFLIAVLVLATLIVALASCAGQQETQDGNQKPPTAPSNEREQMIAGGYSDIETDHPMVTGAIQFLTEHVGPLFPNHRITGIIKAEIQVVAGYNIHLVLSFASPDQTGTLEAVVFTNLEGGRRLLKLEANGEEITDQVATGE